MSTVDYEVPDYIPPKVAVVLDSILRGPRELGHSADFIDLYSSIQEERLAYIDGLAVIPVIFFSVFLAWAFVVIILRMKGAEVGCASGQPFISLRPIGEYSVYKNKNKKNIQVDAGKHEDDLASTSESSNAESISESSFKPLRMGPDGQMIENSNSLRDHHFGMKIWLWMRQMIGDRDDDTEVNRTECATRLSFLIFGCIVLVCASLSLFLTFGPLREATTEVLSTENQDSLNLKIRNIFDGVETSLTTIEELSVEAIEVVNATPTDLEIICPLIDNADFISMIGVDINDIIETIIEQQNNLEDDINAKLSTRQVFMDSMENSFSTFQSYVRETEKFIWILPGLLVAIGSLTLVSIIGVILAWKQKSGSRSERVMSYVVLPLLILLTIACWIAMIAFSLGTMVGADICLTGSPEETILDVVSITNGTEGMTYQFTSSYLEHCDSSYPTKDIKHIKLETQEHIDNIWRQISKIDSVGRAAALERCGNTEEFLELISSARDLAITLTDIRRSLSSLEETTECDSVYPIYTQVTHDVICTQTLSASGYGFIMYLVMWISLMAMISLRASWLKSNIEEARVYHNENEVAENMVVDEHEEYLAYISRYKHEWQEYEGIEEDGVVKSSPRSDFHGSQPTGSVEASDQCYYYGDDQGNEDEESTRISKCDLSTLDSRSLHTKHVQQRDPSKIYQRQLTSHEIMDHHDDGVSYASGEISFASLSSVLKSDSLGNIGNILTLPPPMNPDFSETEQEPQNPEAKGKSDVNLDDTFNPDFKTNFSHDVDATQEEVEVRIKGF